MLLDLSFHCFQLYCSDAHIHHQCKHSIQHKPSAGLKMWAKFYVNTLRFSFLGSFSSFSLSTFTSFNPTLTRVETCLCKVLHVKSVCFFFFFHSAVSYQCFQGENSLPDAEDSDIIQTWILPIASATYNKW